MRATPYPGNSERVDLWDLPQILSVDVKPTRYNPPKQFWVNRQILEVRDGIEILVQLSAPLPSRAVTPALYIGNVPIADYEMAGKNRYRFFVINPTALETNAPIMLGWPQLPKDNLVASNFRFQLRNLS